MASDPAPSQQPLSGGSIDASEVEYYTRLADKWWDRSGPFWPLHTLNELRANWILEQLSSAGIIERNDQPLTGLTVLDIGCGGGILSEFLARAGASVTGIDVVEKNITIAKLHAQQEKLDICYHYQTVEDMAETGQQFDIVFNMEVVEHVANVENFMAASCALVKNNGIQFVATINRNWLAYLIAIVGAEYIARLLPKGTHHYHKLVKPSEVSACLKTGGLTVLQQTGVAVNPFTRTMKTIPFTWVNYMMMAKKIS